MAHAVPPESRSHVGPVTDTRSPGGPQGRVYAAPFARVWDLIVEDVRERRGWELVHADEDLGMLTVVCRLPFPPRHDVTVWVRLDDYGLTRVDVRAAARGQWDPLGLREKRVTGLLDRLDASLGAGSRVRPAGV